MNETKVNEWTTQKGAKVELHTKHITSESHTTDWGEILTKEDDFIMVEKVIVNGKTFSGHINRTTKESARYLDLGNHVINGKKENLCAPLPKEIETSVWGEYDARQEAKASKRKAREIKEAAEMKNKVKSGYCPKCGSYCYGDCTAN